MGTARGIEERLPGSECIVDLAYAISEQAAERDAKAIGRVPNTDAERLLRARVPRRRDEDLAVLRLEYERKGEYNDTELTKAGSAVASKAPPRMRSTASSAKFRLAA